MRNFLLKLAYDGKDFHGFQEQDGYRTVAGELRTAIEHLVGRPTRLIASGRTDVGVHAEMQLVNFLTTTSISPSGFRYHLNARLPEDIVCYHSEAVPIDFHARFSAGMKTYRYVVSLNRPQMPTDRYYKASCTYDLDVEAMLRACDCFVGEHDFSAFCKRDPLRQPIRRIESFTLTQSGHDLIFRVSGESFLHNQVRMMVGALIAIGRGKLDAKTVSRYLREGAARPMATTYPACGLTLEHIEISYPSCYRNKHKGE